MEAVYVELDEAKAEAERLREQCKFKEELAGRLKRAHSEELNKNKEANSRLEKLTQKLQEKEDEIADSGRRYEELRASFNEKECVIKDLSSRYERLRLDCNEKIRRLEDENRVLGMSLDDANGRNMEQDREICSLKQELEGMKRSLNVSVKKKCLGNENQSLVSREIQGRKDECDKLEDEKRKFEDQLKWKKEQFCHLQEAHEKLQNVLRGKEKEWGKERGELLDGISDLEAKLESQTRISRDLEYRLEMCNQAFAHSESKRKLLEGQLSESKTCFDSICAEYDDAKSNFEMFSFQRDQEIASLRSSLSTKEILYKEIEYQFRKLEQEKQDMLASLKELQESHIQEGGGFSSASKAQKKLKSLELLHRGCELNLKARESEWLSEMEKLSEELSLCKSELENRDMSLGVLKRELQSCDSLMLKLELINQEVSLSLLLLKSQFSEAQIRFSDDCSYLKLENNQMQQRICDLVYQMENKKAAISNFQKDLEEEREKVTLLSSKIETLEQLQSPLQQEVERLKEMLEASRLSQVQSQEQVLLIEGDLRKVHDALNRANEELFDKLREANEIEFELQVWKSLAQQMDEALKQNLQMRRDVESSLLSQTEVEVSLKEEKESLNQQLEEKEKQIENLQMQLDEAFDKSDPKRGEEALHQTVEEKDQRIHDLQQLVASLEHEFETSTSSFSSRLAQMQAEIHILRESWEVIKEAEVLKEMDIQEKNTMITELENNVCSLMQRVEQQEKALLSSEKKSQVIQAELEAKLLEIHSLESKLATADVTIKTISENSIRLSSENEGLMNNMSALCQRMEQITEEDTQLMENWGKVVLPLHFSRPPREWSNDCELVEDPSKENMDATPLSHVGKKRAEPLPLAERSPLTTKN